MTKRVLNVGSGAPTNERLHPAFRGEGWSETRLDVDADVQPDIVGSIADLDRLAGEAEFDAVWSSHSLEHLDTHEVVGALGSFRRVLKPDGFALITCPDLLSVSKFLIARGVEEVAYISGLGPIRPLDMLYGHSRSIAAGRHYMAHKTGFTAERLGRVVLEAGFAETRVLEGNDFDLWAICLMPDTDQTQLGEMFAQSNIAQLFAQAA